MKTIISSKTKKATISTDGPFVVIGEKINPTGLKKLAAALQEENYDYVRDLAKKQIEAGATASGVSRPRWWCESGARHGQACRPRGDPGRRRDEVVIARGARRGQGLRDLLEAAEEAQVRVREVPRERLDAMADPGEHRGVVARVRAEAVRATLSESDLAVFGFAHDAIVVVLDGVDDPQNLGVAARSAEAAGAAMLVTRTRRAAPVSPAAIRASAGALAHLPHARVANIARAIGLLSAFQHRMS